MGFASYLKKLDRLDEIEKAAIKQVKLPEKEARIELLRRKYDAAIVKSSGYPIGV
jgi:hypothetical protein